MSQSTLWQYYRRFWKTFGSLNWTFGRDQIVALAVAVTIIILQVHNGLATETNKWPNINIVSTVLVCVLLAYVGTQLIRTPWILHKEAEYSHSKECADLRQQIASLQTEAAEQQRTMTVLKQQLQQPMPNLLIRLGQLRPGADVNGAVCLRSRWH